MLELNYFQDPGHGWVEVSRSLAEELGIKDKITSYSYQNANYYFLEEDCDAPLLLKELKNRNIEYQINERYSETGWFFHRYDTVH